MGRADGLTANQFLMNKLVQIITDAIAFIFSQKEANKQLREELKAANDKLEAQAVTIETLQQQVADDNIDDAALEEAATTARADADAAKARLEELEASLVEADEKSAELAAAINENPETPNVDPEFNVVE